MVDEQLVTSQSHTPKTAKPDILELARQKYLERNRNVEQAVKKVRRKMKFQNEDHESKFARRMSAFSNLNTYFNIGEFLSKLGRGGIKQTSEKQLPKRPPQIVRSSNPHAKHRNLSVRASDDEGVLSTCKTQETEGSRTERDPRSNYREALNMNLEELRKKKARNDQLFVLLNEDNTQESFDNQLEEQLLFDPFDTQKVSSQELTDEAAIKKIEELREMLHAKRQSQTPGIEAQKEHLQNFKRRSDNVINLLRRAAKNMYKHNDGDRNRASSLNAQAQSNQKENSMQSTMKLGEVSTNKIEANKEMNLFELTSINLRDASGVKASGIKRRELRERSVSKGKENVPSLSNVNQPPSGKSTARCSSNSVKENKKINTAYEGYLQVILSQTDEEKKEIEKAREAAAKKAKRMSLLMPTEKDFRPRKPSLAEPQPLFPARKLSGANLTLQGRINHRKLSVLLGDPNA